MEIAFASKAEQQLARELRIILADLPVGGSVPESDEFRTVRSALEFFIPQVLREIYPEWNHESLDGIYPSVARKTAKYALEIIGLCLLISDQTLTPIQLHFETSPDKDEIVWLECKLGESGSEGMVRIPYDSKRVCKFAVADRLDTIEWIYSVGFGEPSFSKPQ